MVTFRPFSVSGSFFMALPGRGLIGSRGDIQAEAERNAVSTEHPEWQHG